MGQIPPPKENLKQSGPVVEKESVPLGKVQVKPWRLFDPTNLLILVVEKLSKQAHLGKESTQS
ncbi:hypothetical protein RV11_GL000022 [Enterococcus phoeniculicola]|nr:hypothetical protein RV11_GL000022 [Enterococcus phoeniculicola]